MQSNGFRNTEFRNTILQKLDAGAIDRLQLRPVTLGLKHTLEAAGEEIKNIYFVEAGLGSMTHSFEDGSEVEVGMFGHESVIGAWSLMGTRRSLNHVYMQVPGNGFVTTGEAARREFRRMERFHELVLRYVQAQGVQVAQTAACNARHELKQRLARWLLLCHDRTMRAEVITLTQEFLSQMLGVARPTVSVVAEELQRRGAIEYRRGKVRILSREQLERTSCECYAAIREHLDGYGTVESGFAA